MIHYKYVLSITELSGYGEHSKVLREFYSRDALSKYSLSLINQYVKDGYDSRETDKDTVLLSKMGSQFRLTVDTVEFDDEGAPWNV